MKKQTNLRLSVIAVTLSLFAFTSCDDLEQYEPIEANSIADVTPPSASFSSTQGEGPDEEWKDYTFANTSSSATNYTWDFGNGEIYTPMEGETPDGSTTYPGEGMYIVTLVASDDNGVSSTFTETINVVEPEVPQVIIPVIGAPGFDLGNTDATKDPWRNSDLGGVIQVTGSPVHQGAGASKYPSAGDRIAYQELTVSQNSDYILTYYYTLKTNNPGSVTVSVLAGGSHTDLSAALATAIADFEGTDQTSASTYVQANIAFSTGTNDTVSILITNQGEEARVDTFSIAAQ